MKDLNLHPKFHSFRRRFYNLNSKRYSMDRTGQYISFNGRVQILSFVSFVALTRVGFFLKQAVQFLIRLAQVNFAQNSNSCVICPQKSCVGFCLGKPNHYSSLKHDCLLLCFCHEWFLSGFTVEHDNTEVQGQVLYTQMINLTILTKMLKQGQATCFQNFDCSSKILVSLHVTYHKKFCIYGIFGHKIMKISFREKHLFIVAINITSELLINYCKD